MKNIIATWMVELNCHCPKCGEYVNLLDYIFWEMNEMQIPESGTDRSRNVEVKCPECSHDFLIDCEY